MIRLPDAEGLIVAYDTESSGLVALEGARVCSFSLAWRDPADSTIQGLAVPIDLGFDHSPWLGAKSLPADHARRLDQLIASHGRQMWDVHNYGQAEWQRVMAWLCRQRLVMHNAEFDCLMTSAGPRGHPELGVDLMPHLIWDTLPAQQILQPKESGKLKPTAVRLHLGEELGIEQGTEDAEQQALQHWLGPPADPRYDLIPWQVLELYAIDDARFTLLLYEWQQRKLASEPESDRLHQQVREKLEEVRWLYRARLPVIVERARQEAGPAAAQAGSENGAEPRRAEAGAQPLNTGADAEPLQADTSAQPREPAGAPGPGPGGGQPRSVRRIRRPGTHAQEIGRV